MRKAPQNLTHTMLLAACADITKYGGWNINPMRVVHTSIMRFTATFRELFSHSVLAPLTAPTKP